jgi:anti-sigma regulatory factor (Ser/Thr protein kinase)
MSSDISSNGATSAHAFAAFGRGGVPMRNHIGSELSVRFDRGPTAASAARNALLSLEAQVEPPVLDDIRLLVSELVTNAIRHADAPSGGEVALDVSIADSAVRVEVADPGEGFQPEPRDHEMSRPGGWGLYLVDRIADRWGVLSNQMNRVWFELESGARTPGASV